jgi:hypothetical protein
MDTMANALRQTIEKRRAELIHKLLYFKVFQKDVQYLLELPLSDLENEFENIQLQLHPHNNFGSIQWVKNK